MMSCMFSIRIAALVGLIAGVVLSVPALAQVSLESAPPSAAVTGAAAPIAPPVRKTSPYRPTGTTGHAKTYYQSVWGIDNLLVRATASGNLIRFSYRVTNPAQANPLASKQATPYLYGQRSNAVLHVPVMDKVGDLRQSGPQEAGQSYWMVFSNKGNLVRSGDRVDVFIGAFHATGLVVE